LAHPFGVQTSFTLQATPHLPQFCGSAFVLTHSLPHFVKPASQATSHRLF
jgi:hypothetical protein